MYSCSKKGNYSKLCSATSWWNSSSIICTVIVSETVIFKIVLYFKKILGKIAHEFVFEKL